MNPSAPHQRRLQVLANQLQAIRNDLTQGAAAQESCPDITPHACSAATSLLHGKVHT